MRLLNATSFHFKEFFGEEVPPYAILSHVWSAQELTYEDFLAGRGKDLYGYEKIVKLCERTRSSQSELDATPLEYCWIDTICIDKRSSAELSEAINSMYAWYEKAKICFVFLPDVEPLPPAYDDGKAYTKPPRGVPFDERQFVDSKWFTRGWTLQELVAPPHVLFFNNSYEIIGQKGVTTGNFLPLTELIQEASGIRISSLLGHLCNNPRDVCIAQRMSWASKRQTTRPEDIAYCLLGIFQVNLPLLYGEGAGNAFLRLQEAIIARSTDESIFAWETDDSASQPWSGLLAPSPKAFWNCSDMWTVRPEGPEGATTYAITQRGLELSMLIDPTLISGSTATWCFLYGLPCYSHRQPWARHYLKIWVAEVTMDGRRYVDVKLAWRSGIVTLETDNENFMHRRDDRRVAAEREAYKRAMGREAPKLLNFTNLERQVWDLSQSSQGKKTGSKFQHQPMRQSLMKVLKIRPKQESTMIKLYFKTHFSSGETPIATAMLRSLT